MIYRVIGARAEARPFLENLKQRLKADFAQEEILMVERDVQDAVRGNRVIEAANRVMAVRVSVAELLSYQR